MLEFPFDEPPHAGEVTKIRPGILWARIPLPFRLDHVNIYFLADADGWYIIDTGIDHADGRAAWLALLDGPLRTLRFKGLIVTHHHPDHIGLAGWLCEMLSIPLLTSRTSFFTCMTFTHAPAILEADEYRRFFMNHGMTEELSAIVAVRGHEYLQMLSPLPKTFRRLASGDSLRIGGRSFSVLSAEGHCAEQLMLYCAEDEIFFAADQVIEKISPNVSVMPFEPEGDPLGEYLQSLEMLRNRVSAHALILSGHRLPFIGIQERCLALADHHEAKFRQIELAVRESPRSANELVSLLYPKVDNPHELSFAFSEVLSHLNFMIAKGRLRQDWRGEMLVARMPEPVARP